MLILIFGGVGGNWPDWVTKNNLAGDLEKSLGSFSRGEVKRVEIRAIERRQLLCVAPVCVAG